MDNGKEWANLCDEYEQVDKDVRDLRGAVNRKFSAIAAGISRENPTENELTQLEEARARRDAIDQRTRDFMRTNFGVVT